MTDATYYKKRFELSETKREAEASISAKKIQLWQDAYTALLAASTGKAEDWREAIARLLDVIADLEEDGVMYEEMLKNRDEIDEKAFSEPLERRIDTLTDALKQITPA